MCLSYSFHTIKVGLKCTKKIEICNSVHTIEMLQKFIMHFNFLNLFRLLFKSFKTFPVHNICIQLNPSKICTGKHWIQVTLYCFWSCKNSKLVGSQLSTAKQQRKFSYIENLPSISRLFPTWLFLNNPWTVIF